MKPMRPTDANTERMAAICDKMHELIYFWDNHCKTDRLSDCQIYFSNQALPLAMLMGAPVIFFARIPVAQGSKRFHQ